MIRIQLPAHLQTLARSGAEVTVDVQGPVTQRTVLDALEARYPTLGGTVRDHVTKQRRSHVRFFACQEIARSNRRTPRCPKRSRPAPNPSSSSARWRAARRGTGRSSVFPGRHPPFDGAQGGAEPGRSPARNHELGRPLRVGFDGP